MAAIPVDEWKTVAEWLEIEEQNMVINGVKRESSMPVNYHRSGGDAPVLTVDTPGPADLYARTLPRETSRIDRMSPTKDGEPCKPWNLGRREKPQGDARHKGTARRVLRTVVNADSQEMLGTVKEASIRLHVDEARIREACYSTERGNPKAVGGVVLTWGEKKASHG